MMAVATEDQCLRVFSDNDEVSWRKKGERVGERGGRGREVKKKIICLVVKIDGSFLILIIYYYYYYYFFRVKKQF